LILKRRKYVPLKLPQTTWNYNPEDIFFIIITVRTFKYEDKDMSLYLMAAPIAVG
jgi:hypothetical protein